MLVILCLTYYISQTRKYNKDNDYGYHIVNISSKNINKFLVFTSRSRSIMEILQTGKSFTTMGEMIITLSAIYGFQNLGYQVIIVTSRYDFQLHNNNIIGYILDYKTLEQVKDLVLTKESIEKVTFFCSWGRSDEEMKRRWSNGKYYLPSYRVLTPYDLGGYTSDGKTIANNTFLGFLPSMLEVQNNKSTEIVFDKNTIGYWLGKNEYLLFFNNSETIINYVTSKGHNLYVTSDEFKKNIRGIQNLGLLSRNKFFDLLKHIKYIIGTGQPMHGTSLIEILQEEIFLLAPSPQMPYGIRNHPNYICTDNMNHIAIEKFISSVTNGEIKPVRKNIEQYTTENYMKRLCKIYNISPCTYKWNYLE